MSRHVYRPDAFNARSLKQARRIILTPEDDVTSEERWRQETPWVANALEHVLQIRPEHTVIDFGCGIGRLAKGLVSGLGCAVLGVDISPTMRAHAALYVRNPQFSALAPEGLARLAGAGLQADSAFAVWVLQHCMEPKDEIARIRAALKPGGRFAVINSHLRWIPTQKGWVQDRKNVSAALDDAFERVAEHPLAVGPMSAELVKDSFFRVYRKPAGA